MRFIKATLMLLGVACLVFSLTGCHTVKGIGRDIHDGAQSTEEFLGLSKKPQW